ncbi:MAG: Site-specific tyrosine recombinase [uncultured Thermomicrobiales bacterium]|uniref:Site-specific tyrosine recombinase n=1 Tax=uncultured Thermomicrobiales bacterium TaxID=1645740 RepID=A0A6J4UL51_9BACT|nr:MAG: Site-specific tyrosine recombinase [uncultured Thermomicrobiales bacterium]
MVAEHDTSPTAFDPEVSAPLSSTVPVRADGASSVEPPEEALTLEAAVEMFFGDLRLAPRSKRTYRQGIKKFLNHLLVHEGIDATTAPVTALQTEHVTSFAAILVPPDIRTPEEVSQMRTAQNNLSAVRKLCAYLSAYDLHPDLATDRLRVRISAMMPRFTPPPPDVKLTDLERIVEHVNSLPKEEKPHLDLRRLKVRAMIRFMFRTGVRVSELCALRRRDVDLDGGTAGIYRAKGGKSRTVHFDAGTADALVSYWRARGDAVRGSGAFPAFSGRDKVGLPGAAISSRTVEHIVAEICKEIGIESDVTPHSFRHGLATELVRRRVRESTVQTILGHASPQTTRIYVHKTGLEVAEEYQDAFGAYRKPSSQAE